MGKDEPDISELVEKAKIVAEATGRDEQEVLADLLDDGIVNLSNEESKGKDLVTQLKEAAELITTVQSINKEVSENKVLNGGENSTEVKVETTLEGDIVDRAIESMQRKSENIKKLIITMTPLFLLATGGGLEALGIIDMMDSEEDDYYDPSFAEIYGVAPPPMLKITWKKPLWMMALAHGVIIMAVVEAHLQIANGNGKITLSWTTKTTW